MASGDEVVLYTRDGGPICYELPLLFRGDAPDKLASLLLTTALAWVWTSGRSGASANGAQFDKLPDRRPWTRLAPATKGTFEKDLSERDEEQNGRWIILVGAAPEEAGLPIADGLVEKEIKRFASTESGPVRIVVVQIEDLSKSQVYVPHKPHPSVVELLAHWGIHASESVPTRPYSRLRVIALEKLRPLSGREP